MPESSLWPMWRNCMRRELAEGSFPSPAGAKTAFSLAIGNRFARSRLIRAGDGLDIAACAASCSSDGSVGASPRGGCSSSLGPGHGMGMARTARRMLPKKALAPSRRARAACAGPPSLAPILALDARLAAPSVGGGSFSRSAMLDHFLLLVFLRRW